MNKKLVGIIILSIHLGIILTKLSLEIGFLEAAKVFGISLFLTVFICVVVALIAD